MIVFAQISHQTSITMLKTWPVLLLLLIYQTDCHRDTTLFTSGSYTDPTFECSSYCMYTVNANKNLDSQCDATSTMGNNGGCLQCDETLFRQVNDLCLAHQYTGEKLVASVGYGGAAYRLGWRVPNNPAGNPTQFDNTHTAISIPLNDPHFAVRIRFAVFMFNFDDDDYYYPLGYSMDQTDYTYSQSLRGYWSSYDIITSELQNHSRDAVAITFRNLNNSYPRNTQCSTGTLDGSCDCLRNYNTFSGGSCSFAGSTCTTVSNVCGTFSPNVFTCCDARYIQIRDLLIFASQCPEGCLICSSTSTCQLCDNTTGWYRYPTDNTCYQTCPQTTYADNTAQLVDLASNTTQFWCSDCPATCLQCSSPSSCSICFEYGRNESFLFNNTCITTCVNGYEQNYTVHECQCPQLYHYEINTVLIMLCIACSEECIRCTGNSNLECTECVAGYFLANGTTHCLNSCPGGQFVNQYSLTCHLCSGQCSACTGSATHCTECFFATQKYLLRNECLSWCPPGYEWDNTTSTCDECTLYTYSYQGQCMSSCPDLYEENLENKSCNHYSVTGKQYELRVVDLSIPSHGKLLKIVISLGDGVNATSQTWLEANSYHAVSIIYKDTSYASGATIRSLQNTTLTVRNLLISTNQLTYYTTLPSTLDYYKAFQIQLTQTIYSANDIPYNNYSTTLTIDQQPSVMKEYYLYNRKNLYHLWMVPFTALLILLMMLQVRGTYDMLMELLRVVQMLGLAIYSVYPIYSYSYYFLLGCSYANLQFIPNPYTQHIRSYPHDKINTYYLNSDDMDFLRINGSALLFSALWLVVYMVCRCLIDLSPRRLKFVVNFGCDLLEVKILHSFWSSFVYICINETASDINLFVTFALATAFLIGVLARRVILYKELNQVSPFFPWRFFGTLLIVLLGLAPQLIVMLLLLCAVAAGICEFYLLHSSRYVFQPHHLTSHNYMDESTTRVLNSFDNQIDFAWAIPFRNTLVLTFPAVTTIMVAVVALIKDFDQEVVWFEVAIGYFLLLFVPIVAIFVYQYIKARRDYLVEHKLRYLRQKYAQIAEREQTLSFSRNSPSRNRAPSPVPKPVRRKMSLPSEDEKMMVIEGIGGNDGRLGRTRFEFFD